MWNRPLENALKNAIDRHDLGRIKALAKMIDDEAKRTDAQSNKEGLLSHNEEGQTFLLYALAHHNLDAFHILYHYYRHNSELLQLRDKKGRSLFWYAIAWNEIEIAKELYTCAWNEMEIAEELFACNFTKPKKANETWLQCDNEGVSPLHLAARSMNETLLSWLLFKLKDEEDKISLVNACDPQLDAPLHIACRHKRRLNIKSLLESGAAIDLPNAKGETCHTYLEKDPTLFPNQEELNKIQKKAPRTPLKELDSPYRRMRQDEARLSGVIGKLDAFKDELNSLPAPQSNRINTAHVLRGTGQGIALVGGFLTFIPLLASILVSLMHSIPILTLLTMVPGVGIGLLIMSALLFIGLCLYGASLYINNSVQKDLQLQAAPIISEINNLTQELTKIDSSNPDVLQVDAATIHLFEKKSENIRKKFEETNLRFCSDINNGDISKKLNVMNNLIKDIQAAINTQKKPLTPARIAASVDEPNNDTVIDLTPSPSFSLPPPASSPRLFGQSASGSDEEELPFLDRDKSSPRRELG